jgi:micrococcal nuclease
VAVALVAGAAVTGAVPAGALENTTVEHIVDGDTFDVRTGNVVTRIRLLNVDTPEMKGPDGLPECLAPEATATLASLLPIGSAVQLDYDVVKADRYGRTLAAAINSGGIDVGAELARLGLAVPLTVGGNDRFRPTVDAAAQGARAAQTGVFDPNLACTPTAMVAALEAQARTMPETLPKDTAGIALAIASAAGVQMAAESTGESISAMTWLSKPLRKTFDTRVAAVLYKSSHLKSRGVEKIGPSHSAETSASTQKKAAQQTKAKADKQKAKGSAAKKARSARDSAARNAAAQRAGETARIAAEIEAARVAAEAEAARVAAEAEAARVAAEAAAAEAARVAREDAARRTASQGGSSGGSSGSGGSAGSGAGDGGGSTYTGCRNYNGYGMIDTKGRHFQPIPCP